MILNAIDIKKKNSTITQVMVGKLFSINGQSVDVYAFVRAVENS